MTKGTKLLLQGRFRKAIPLLERAAKRDWQDDMKIGPICDLGVAHLCAGHYAKAERHFEDLIQTASYTIGKHFIYLGLTHWFRDDYATAVDIWRKGLRCQYGEYKGMDVPLVLYYASVRSPQHFAPRDAIELVREFVPQHDPEDLAYVLARFVCGDVDADELRAAAVAGPFAERVIVLQQLEVEFYIACANLHHDADEGAFMSTMRRCADGTGLAELMKEHVIAVKEVQKRRRRPTSR